MFSTVCQGFLHMHILVRATEGIKLRLGTSETDMGLDSDVPYKRKTRLSHAGLTCPDSSGISEDKQLIVDYSVKHHGRNSKFVKRICSSAMQLDDLWDPLSQLTLEARA